MTPSRPPERADLLVACNCGALVPEMLDPTHSYLFAAPGCWKTYGDVLAREYSSRAFMGLHRLTVDSYAVQHSASPDPRNHQSVATHLVSLCLVLDLGLTPEQATSAMGRYVRIGRTTGFPHLEPPRSPGSITVVDVARCSSVEDHLACVLSWAQSVWLAWAEQHETVRAWIGRTDPGCAAVIANVRARRRR